VADFVVKQLGNLKNVAVDAKTSGPWGYDEPNTSQLPKGQLIDYLANVGVGRFGGLVYINVPIGGNQGFTPVLQQVLDLMGVGFKALY
jgi:hypothetical protein